MQPFAQLQLSAFGGRNLRDFAPKSHVSDGDTFGALEAQAVEGEIVTI